MNIQVITGRNSLIGAKVNDSAYQNLGAGIETGRTGIKETILPDMQVIRRK